ncbi:MAG: DUF2269 family protein [Acidimicrobiales bacterium]
MTMLAWTSRILFPPRVPAAGDDRRAMAVTSPLYDVVMAVHVLAAVVGFGALGSTGAYAAALRRDGDPFASRALRRYFTPGPNWPARAVLLVPLLGGTLLALGHGRDVGYPWPWIGLAVWTAATGLASAVLWPAEREIQALLAAGAAGAAGAGDGDAGTTVGVAEGRADLVERLVSSALRAERAAAVTSLLFVVALVVMVWQP